MPFVPMPNLKQNWLLERSSSAMVGTSPFCRIMACTLPAMERRVILR